MLSPVLGAAFPRSNVMKSKTLLPTYTHGGGGGGGGGDSRIKTFFNVRVFNPHARSKKSLEPPASYRKHKHEKKWPYEQLVREVEHSTFTPPPPPPPPRFSATGGMAAEATNFYNRLASVLALKWNFLYIAAHCYCVTTAIYASHGVW